MRSNVLKISALVLSMSAGAQSLPAGEESSAAASVQAASVEQGAPAVQGAPAKQASPDGQAAPAEQPGPEADPGADALAVAPPPALAPELESAQLGPAPQAVTARGPTQGRPLVVRRGFYTDTNLGTFFTLGGNDQYSNAQSYVQLGLGYDLFDFLAVGAHVAFGSNAFNCFAGRVGGACARSDAFTVTFFDASLTYLHRLGNRFYLTPKVVAGYTLLDPEPVSGQAQGINVGAGIGVEYATAMDHFSVGADVLGRYVLGANIPTVAIFPRVKYTF